MAFQATFKRYELKYMLTPEQKAAVMNAMAPYMALDKYGRTVIRNIYYDTDNYRLIRTSLEKPVYKEKLRLRSYRQLMDDEPAFVELKKKFDNVVYKRRLSMPQSAAMDWLGGNYAKKPDCQIASEIEYFTRFYQTLHPVVFLSYEREALYCKDGGDFRVTFDESILCRSDRLSLTEDVGGMPILEPGKVLMEIKTAGGIPLWMTHVLTENKIFKTSFSKYGTAYRTMIYKGARQYA